MKYVVALLLAASAISLSPVQAANIADLARANCVKAFMSSAAQVDRGMLAKFQFTKKGNGYSLSGMDQGRNMVECLAAADGHVEWIHGG